MILDGRHAPLRFGAADSVELATGAAFAQISVDGDEPVSIGGVDIADTFYQIEVPPWLRRFFGLPRARAGAWGWPTWQTAHLSGRRRGSCRVFGARRWAGASVCGSARP